MAQLVEAGIEVRVPRTKTVWANGRCRGYFDGEVLNVAVRNPIAQWTFVHEFCHFLQWLEDRKPFVGEDALTKIERRRLRLTDWGDVWKNLQLEHDCERRVIRLGKKWGLFTEEEYAPRSNVYMYFYHFVWVTGQWWNTGNLGDRKLVGSMSKRLVPLRSLERVDPVMMARYARVLGGNRG